MPASNALRVIAGKSPTADAILRLQRTTGNHAVTRLLQQERASGVRVGAVDDPLEREADRIATRVTTETPSASHSAPVRRTSSHNDLRDSFETGPKIEGELHSNKGSGVALPARLRSELEPQMGADFSKVRVHTGAASDRLNRSLGAQAFTYGADIYMGAGKYAPASNKGRHLLTHELTHVMQQGDGIQRYPSDSMSRSSHINWDLETASVFHPGEGISGGVYIFTGVGGPVNKLVIKPEYVDAADQNAKAANTITAAGHGSFANKILSKIGIRTPVSRAIDPGAPEEGEILAAATKHAAAIPADMGDEFMAQPLAFLTVMGQVGGRSISGEAKSVADMWDANSLIGRLNRPALMHQVGEIMAVDSFMENPDRIMVGAANMGNIMFADNIATAIDSGSSFRHIANQVHNNPFILPQITKLFGEREALVDSFFEGVERGIEDDDARAHFAQYKVVMQAQYQTWRNDIKTGITSGIAKIKAMLANKAARKDLKKEANRLGGMGATKTKWEGFRMSEKYFNLLEQGTDPTEARRQLEEYRLYRETRTKRLKGFKWTSKFFKKKVPAQPVNG